MHRKLPHCSKPSGGLPLTRTRSLLSLTKPWSKAERAQSSGWKAISVPMSFLSKLSLDCADTARAAAQFSESPTKAARMPSWIARRSAASGKRARGIIPECGDTRLE
jgi:hypothetical protein